VLWALIEPDWDIMQSLRTRCCVGSPTTRLEFWHLLGTGSLHPYPKYPPLSWIRSLVKIQSKVQELLPQELYDRLLEVQVDSWKPGPEDFLPIYHGESGELLVASPAPFTLRLQRRKFQKLLATGIDIHVSQFPIAPSPYSLTHPAG
jgi:hypothetical protein